MLMYSAVVILFIVFVNTAQCTTKIFLLKRNPRSVLQPDNLQASLIKKLKGTGTIQYDFADKERIENLLSIINKNDGEEKRCKQRFASIYGQKLRDFLCQGKKQNIEPLSKKKLTTLRPIQDIAILAEKFLDSRDENFDRSGSTLKRKPQYGLTTQESQVLIDYLENQRREKQETVKASPFGSPHSPFSYDYYYERGVQPEHRLKNILGKINKHPQVTKAMLSEKSMFSEPKYNSKNKYAALLLESLKTLKSLDKRLKRSYILPTPVSNVNAVILDKVALPTLPESLLEYNVYDFIDSTEDLIADNKVDTIDEDYSVNETSGRFMDTRRQRLPHFLPKRTYFTGDQARQLRQFWFTNTVQNL